jgi:hypothetical protein
MDKEEQLLYWKKTGEKYRESAKAKIALLLRMAKKRSERNGWEFDLTKEWITERIQRNTCELSGQSFMFKNTTHNTHFNPYSPSIDRIDSSKGYTKDNCRVVLACINMGIGEWGLDTYLDTAAKVLAHQKK